MDHVILFGVVAVLIVAGIYFAAKKHPASPHHDCLMELARRCLPEEAESKLRVDEFAQAEPTQAQEEALRSRHLV